MVNEIELCVVHIMVHWLYEGAQYAEEIASLLHASFVMVHLFIYFVRGI